MNLKSFCFTLLGTIKVISAKLVFLTFIGVIAPLSVTDAQGNDPNQGPGGPILILADSENPFGRYLAEILRNEGFNLFTVADVETAQSINLNLYDLILLGESELTSGEANLLSTWISQGGKLIAMRPDSALSSTLGLTDTGSTQDEGYISINTGSSPGLGLTEATLQFHGTADKYTLNGATEIATLFLNSSESSGFPAVTLNTFGQGLAAAFTFDLARSVVYTRQGNPDWAGQERDGDFAIRPWEMFFSFTEGEEHWVALNRIHIPQADEQQRLLGNLILEMLDYPMPRFWYLPDKHKATVVMTGDEHSCCVTTDTRLDLFKDMSPHGCSLEDWECVRSTSYVYPPLLSPPTWSDADMMAATNSGFELAPHITSGNGCNDYTGPGPLQYAFDTQLHSFTQNFPSALQPQTNRMHCVVWSDWSTVAEVEESRGIRFDTSYYYRPATISSHYSGVFTGSGLPMRFAKSDGTMIDVFQATTQMSDESGQTYPITAEQLLSRATGPEGYYGAFTVNMHQNNPSNTEGTRDAARTVATAQSQGVPVVSARQMLNWIDGRNQSSFNIIHWNEYRLDFAVDASSDARNLQGMLPASSAGHHVARLYLNGESVEHSPMTVKGIDYTFFEATTGTYEAQYDLICDADTTVADFSSGETIGTTITPADAAEFETMALPAGWETVIYSGGNGSSFDGDTIELDGARVNTESFFNPGVALEFTATFVESRYQHIGFGDTFQEPLWAIFSTGANGDTLLARVHNGNFNNDVDLGAYTLGTAHRYRIEWRTNRVDFFIDGGRVHSEEVHYTSPMRPVAGDSVLGEESLQVDWMRIGDNAMSVNTEKVRLTPITMEDFNDPFIGNNYVGDDYEVVTYPGGVGSTIEAGIIELNGARINTTQFFDPNQSLTFVAKFADSKYQHIGFGNTFNEPLWAIFSTGADGNTLQARTHNGSQPVNFDLGPTYLDEFHQYRIDWEENEVRFYIDDELMHTQSVTYSQQMRPIGGDSTLGSGTLKIASMLQDSNSSFESRVFGNGQPVDWTGLSWAAEEPAGSTVILSVRAGPTDTPDESWTSYYDLPFSGAPLPNEVVGDYLQYKARLSTPNAKNLPALSEVRLYCSSTGSY